MTLPNSDDIGEIEDLCLESVETYPAMYCVNKFVECFESRCQPLPRKMSKAKVQAFLATKEKHCISLGLAAEIGYWPFDALAFNEVKDFILKIAT
jgi:hypothetical protein